MNPIGKVLPILSVAFIVGMASEAQAGKMRFGPDERIRTIQVTNDPEWVLCYKLSTYFFVAGCYVTDDGYVLRRAGETRSYTKLTPELIKTHQASGMLPNPLPPYSLSILDYVFGYSNWIVLAVVVGIG